MKRYILEIEEDASCEAVIAKIKKDIKGVRLSEINDADASFSCPKTALSGYDASCVAHEQQRCDGLSAVPEVCVQLTDGFEIFVDGRIMEFRRSKARELMAMLVLRHGQPLTTREIAYALWPDEPYGSAVKNKVTRTVSSLKHSMGAAGISMLLIKKWNQLSLDTEKIKYDEI